MSTTYAPKQAPAQKKDAPAAASVLDASSQSESLQRKADMANNAAQRAEAPRPNNTGMPDNLKSSIESLSGFSMDDVRVHYNSSKPATVQALAYTQGTDIHVAPGQEKHLPHEAWHVAQQMAGRVSPTTNINGMPVNDNAALEHEADVMGEKAIQCEKNINTTKNHIFGETLIQRMPLVNTYKKKGIKIVEDGYKFKEDKSTKELINKETYELEVANFDDKASAIQHIATKGGNVGDATELSNDEEVNIRIPASYGTTNRLEMTYHYGQHNKGYVTTVTVNGQTRTMKEKPTPADLTTEYYSSIHDNIAAESLLNHTNGADFSANVADAYSQLAGEGARFDCVKRNIPWIRDDTVFVLEDENKGVMFSELWLTWRRFDCKYNIPDRDIANAFDSKGRIKKDKQERKGCTTASIAFKGNRVILDGESLIIDDDIRDLAIKESRDSLFRLKEDNLGRFKHFAESRVKSIDSAPSDDRTTNLYMESYRDHYAPKSKEQREKKIREYRDKKKSSRNMFLYSEDYDVEEND